MKIQECGLAVNHPVNVSHFNLLELELQISEGPLSCFQCFVRAGLLFVKNDGESEL